MIILADLDGNKLEVEDGQPYDGIRWHVIDTSPSIAGLQHDTDAADLVQQISAELDSEGIQWGDVLKMLFKPAALLLGKSDCLSCDVRRVILNSASQLIKKLGKAEAYTRMKRLIYNSFTKEPSVVLVELKEILGD